MENILKTKILFIIIAMIMNTLFLCGVYADEIFYTEELNISSVGRGCSEVSIREHGNKVVSFRLRKKDGKRLKRACTIKMNVSRNYNDSVLRPAVCLDVAVSKNKINNRSFYSQESPIVRSRQIVANECDKLKFRIRPGRRASKGVFVDFAIDETYYVAPILPEEPEVCSQMVVCAVDLTSSAKPKWYSTPCELYKNPDVITVSPSLCE